MSVQPKPTGRRWWEPWDGVADRIHRRYTTPQQDLFDNPYHLCASWGANGIGKSMALAEYTRRAMAGELPWQRPGPRTVVLAGNTWVQLGVTMKYLWDRLEPGWFRPGVRYESGGVKGQRLAVFDVVGGPGKGGELRLGTFNAPNLAGPRAEVVATDEPLPESVYNELWGRLFGRDGRMVQTYTPTLGTTAKLDYLWDIVDDASKPWAGQIHTPLTLDAVTPRGGLIEVPWVTRTELARFESGLSRHEVEMRMGRSRKPATLEAYFSAWGQHLRRDWTPPAGTLIGVGTDHGSKPGAQRSSLVYVRGEGQACRAHIGAHYKGDGRTDTTDDAKGILLMLDRAGVAIEDVDYWVGDRAHGGDKWGGIKSNVRLQEGIARELGIRVDGRKRYQWVADLPPKLREMHKPRKYDGSVWDGVDIMHRMMVGERLTVSTAPDCDPVDEDFSVWQARMLDPAKDGIDSNRYIIVPLYDGLRAA